MVAKLFFLLQNLMGPCYIKHIYSYVIYFTKFYAAVLSLNERKEAAPPPALPLRPSPIQHFTLYSFNLKSVETHNQMQYNTYGNSEHVEHA